MMQIRSLATMLWIQKTGLSAEYGTREKGGTSSISFRERPSALKMSRSRVDTSMMLVNSLRCEKQCIRTLRTSQNGYGASHSPTPVSVQIQNLMLLIKSSTQLTPCFMISWPALDVFEWKLSL